MRAQTAELSSTFSGECASRGGGGEGEKAEWVGGADKERSGR